MKVRVIVTTAAVALSASPLSGCAAYHKVRQMSEGLNDTPSTALTDQQRTELIDSLRPSGSFEAARDRLTAIAESAADKISQATGGRPWKRDTTSGLAQSSRQGLPCDNGVFAGTALRPSSAPVVFDLPFTSEGFETTVAAIRQEAAALGAREESSLFDDPARREYVVSGNGYTFRFLQLDSALLTVDGDCHLLQKVIDSPPG